MKKVKCVTIALILIIILFNIVPIQSVAALKAKVREITEEEIAQVLGGEGVTISNVKIHGMPSQVGYFEKADTYIKGFENLKEGIVLSTGDATKIFKPSTERLSRSYSGLSTMSNDTVVIEFDAISDGDNISFQYLFGSEEFDQSSKYNDCFHLYVNEENIAKMFGTDISMETFRTLYPKYYYDNSGREGYGFFLGYSTLLSCQAKVKAGEINKFRLEISDVGDCVLDSAIFIKANSISNNEAPDIETNPNPSPAPGETNPNEPGNPGNPGNPDDPDDKYSKDPNKKIKIEKEVSKVKLSLADGRVINNIELENGESVNELKSAFLLDDIYLIVDNEIIQGACLEIEYKIKVKNNSDMSCTELLIEDYLDSGLVCLSENWEYDENDDKIVKFYQAGDLENPVIEAKSEYVTTMVASRQLTTTSSNEYEFKNQARAKVINRGVILTTDVVSSQCVNIIPPFGESQKVNLLIIGFIGSIAFIGILWKIKKK